MRVSLISNKIINKIVKKLFHLKQNFSSDKRFIIKLALAVILVGILSVVTTPNTMRQDIHYKDLLDVIAKGESRGNYNAYYGNAGNNTINFTEMTVGEVLKWQSDYVKNGSPSSAVGRYQFIRPTLNTLVKELQIDHKTKFTETIQDRLAIALLHRRGVNDFVEGKISREQFAHNLSKEWAALPKIKGNNPEASYYGGDGLNAAQISAEEIYSGIHTLIDKQHNS